MAHNTQFDSFEPQTLDYPYVRIDDELSENNRFVRGKNVFVTTGGKLSRRPGTVQMLTTAGNTVALRADRAWFVDTLDNPPIVYMVLSMYNPSTGFWELWHVRLNGSSSLTKSGTYRSIDKSTAPHVAGVARGLLWVKGFPAAGDSEKLGSVVFDGTGGSVVLKPWGLLGPTEPVQLAHVVLGTLPAAITPTAATFSIGSMGNLGESPVGDVIQIDYEQMLITGESISGGITTVTVTRAYNGTAAAQHLAGARILDRTFWSATDHVIEVEIFWDYSYCWITADGHYSNRAPVQTNPDVFPSRTGPFFNQRPQIEVFGTADTTNVTKIGILRTTDGGGTFYLLDTIANPGAQSVLYEDCKLASGPLGTTFHDPIPDTILSAKPVAPTLVSNSPPPTVLAPKITGTDTPAVCSPMSYYQGRWWYAIGNVAFYSAQEELTLGIPEHAWPTGDFGNFFRYQHPVTNTATTNDKLYLLTIKGINTMSGTTRETFNSTPEFDYFGHPWGHPRAVCTFGATVLFLTHDYRIGMIDGSNVLSISDQLYTDIVDQINLGAEIELTYWADLEKEYVMVSGHMKNNPSASKQWVYDVKKSLIQTLQGGYYSPRKYFWFVPWTYPSTLATAGRISETTTQQRIVFFSWDPAAQQGTFARIDPTGQTATDYTIAGTINYDIDVVTNLVRVPTGNHVNAKRQAELSPILYSIVLDRALFAGDEDPLVYYFVDDVWTDPRACDIAEDPPRRTLSKGYKTSEYFVWNVGQRFAFEITKVNSPDRFELHLFHLTFDPDAGA